MVCSKLYMICGNCGQDLTEKGMVTWEYVSSEYSEGLRLVTQPDVLVCCENCGTVHRLFKNVGVEQYKEK